MNIDQQIDRVIDRQAGYVDRPADQGGPSKYGIRLKTLENWLGRACTAADVQAIGKSVAHEIYYSWYYIKPGLDALPPLIQPFMLDAAVDCGRHCAVRFLQDALLSHGFDCGKQDGKIGDGTLAAARLAEERMGAGLLVALVTRRVIYYQNAARFDPGQADQLAGRIARAETFLPAKPQAAHG